MSDNRDVLARAQTALENTRDYEKRHGQGINLAPIISDLMAEVRSLRAAVSSSLIACVAPGCDEAGGICDDVRECGNAYPASRKLTFEQARLFLDVAKRQGIPTDSWEHRLLSEFECQAVDVEFRGMTDRT